MQLFALCLSLLLAAAAGQYLSVYDLLDDGRAMAHTWMEIGYAELNDVSWTEIETTEDQLNMNDDKNVTIFLSLPDYGGETYEDGWPMVPKIRKRAEKTNRGTYKFSAILVQPNDSYCPKLWWTPQHSGNINVGWMAVEEGVYNVSDTMFVIDSGPITRDNSVFIKSDTPHLYHAKSVHNYTAGCDSDDPDAPCTYVDKTNPWDNDKPWLHLGAIQQLQTSVNKGPDGADQELYLSVRARHVFTDRIVLMLMTHSVWQDHNKVVYGELPYNQNFTFPDYPEYETLKTPEIVGYFVWEKDLRLKCVEGLVMETAIRYNEITSNAVSHSYYFTYSIIPALFGMLGTLNSVADSTVLRVFDRTVTEAKYITQEDQCTDEEMKHTTPESAFSMVIGDSPEYFEGQPLETQCFIVYDKQPCTYNILLIDTFGDGWGNNYFEVEIAGETTRYDVPCGSTSITFSTTTCEFNARMKCDGACTTTWENYWTFPFRGVSYYGDHDSTLHVKDHAVTVTDPVNVDPNARVNACDQCKIAPPLLGPNDAANNAADGGDGAGGASPDAQLIGPNVVVVDPSPSPAASMGAGVATVYIVGSGVFFSISASGTASNIMGFSFREGAAGVNGPAIFTTEFHLVGGEPSLNMHRNYFYVSPEAIEALLSGNVYCVVNTIEFPDGELRGQVVAAQVGSTVNLLPENEVPPVTSSGSGQFDFYWYALGDKKAIFYSLVVESADSALTAAHLHLGAAGATGAAYVTLDVSSFTHYPAAFIGVIAADYAAVVANRENPSYVNVHTAGLPTGELRGQADFSEAAEVAAATASASDSSSASSKADAAPKPIVPVVIELFEDTMNVNGWYDSSGAVDVVSYSDESDRRRLDELVVSEGGGVSYSVPHILTYPKYTISNEWNTKLIHSGSICKEAGRRAGFERCEEKLPAHGKFIFRATGWVPSGEQDTWKFCGVEGSVGQELQFEMKKGKCVPGQIIDAPDLCADGGSVVSFVTEVLFDGVVMSEVSRYEALIFENEIAEMMGSVVSVSMNSYTQTSAGLAVTFGVSVAAERYNVDATVVDNIAPFVQTLQSKLNRNLVNKLFIATEMKLQEAGYPGSSLLDATHASILSFNYVGVKYVSPLPADKVVSYPSYNKEVESSSTGSSQSAASFPVAAVASVFGVAVVAVFVAMKIRGSLAGAPAKFEALPTASEHSVDVSEDILSPFDLGMETSPVAL